jgi:hypothetical protein
VPIIGKIEIVKIEHKNKQHSQSDWDTCDKEEVINVIHRELTRHTRITEEIQVDNGSESHNLGIRSWKRETKDRGERR